LNRVSRSATGFTLVELVVVVAIVALLAGVLIPVVTSQIDDAKKSRAAGDMDVVAKAFSTFRTHTSMWPASGNCVAVTSMTTGNAELTEFRCLYANGQELAGWKGPYLNQGTLVNGVMQVATAPSVASGGAGLLDPWGQPYRVYTFAPSGANGGSIMIVCRGPDGTFNSSASDINAGTPAGDDSMVVVSRRL
jgi:general secretion pathway protein G